jgi:cyclic pyranopterin phosphate synthase
MDGLNAARKAGLEPIKVNVVLMRGVNDDEIESFIGFAADNSVEVRFIEHMPSLQADEDHRRLLVLGRDVRTRMDAMGTWCPVDGSGGAPARRWRCESIGVTVGLITSISEPFCHSCERLRLTAEGKLKVCLWSTDDIDLRPHLRPAIREGKLRESFRLAASRKPVGCGERSAMEMSRIGG